MAYIVKENGNALFGDVWIGGDTGYTDKKSEAERFDSKQDALDFLNFTDQEKKSLKFVKVD
jgi:hypothetical protein